ncbi:NADPH-dependent FMN reductase [Streptomyces sviceus]|uniref:NADPH-dependent FMN reductase n=1 Tax=Streptomyces sviceus TaxID=285530 RepID=UPI0036C7326A
MSPSGRTTIAVGSPSGYGHTAAVAEAVACDAAGAGADVVVISEDTITDEQWAQLDDADAIIFGVARHTDATSAAVHAFAEAGSRSGDKSSNLDCLVTLTAQPSMHSISLGLMPGRDSSKDDENDNNRLDFFLEAGTQNSTDTRLEAFHTADLTTAEPLGARVADQVAIFQAGRAALTA